MGIVWGSSARLNAPSGVDSVLNPSYIDRRSCELRCGRRGMLASQAMHVQHAKHHTVCDNVVTARLYTYIFYTML